MDKACESHRHIDHIDSHEGIGIARELTWIEEGHSPFWEVISKGNQ